MSARGYAFNSLRPKLSVSFNRRTDGLTNSRNGQTDRLTCRPQTRAVNVTDCDGHANCGMSSLYILTIRHIDCL